VIAFLFRMADILRRHGGMVSPGKQGKDPSVGPPIKTAGVAIGNKFRFSGWDAGE
jgi:hypothetical protein